jgi:transposase-like protein
MTRHEDNDGTKGKIGVTEGVRRTTGVTPIEAHVGVPDPEVSEKKPRRRFTARYKLRILEEADGCTESGQIGALLRREGLYSSNLNTWRKQRDEGQLQALAPKKRGRKRKPKNPLADRVAQLEREKRRLERELKQARTIIEVQKKISDLLEIPQPDTDFDEDGSNS